MKFNYSVYFMNKNIIRFMCFCQFLLVYCLCDIDIFLFIFHFFPFFLCFVLFISFAHTSTNLFGLTVNHAMFNVFLCVKNTMKNKIKMISSKQPLKSVYEVWIEKKWKRSKKHKRQLDTFKCSSWFSCVLKKRKIKVEKIVAPFYFLR